MHFVAMGSAENFFYQNMTSIGKMGHLYFLWGKLKTNKQCRFKICIFFIIGIIRNMILNFGVRLVAVDSILARKNQVANYRLTSRINIDTFISKCYCMKTKKLLSMNLCF